MLFFVLPMLMKKGTNEETWPRYLFKDDVAVQELIFFFFFFSSFIYLYFLNAESTHKTASCTSWLRAQFQVCYTSLALVKFHFLAKRYKNHAYLYSSILQINILYRYFIHTQIKQDTETLVQWLKLLLPLWNDVLRFSRCREWFISNKFDLWLCGRNAFQRDFLNHICQELHKYSQSSLLTSLPDLFPVILLPFVS